MDGRTSIIANILLSAVKEKYRGDYTDIPEIKVFWHNTVYLFFSSINHRRLFNVSNANFDEMAALKLMPDYLCDFFYKERALLEMPVSAATEEFFAAQFDANECHQGLLNAELNFANGELTILSDKIIRDSIGSYYTPRELAAEIVKKAFAGKKFEASGEYKIADLSCGGGDFFLAVMNWMKERWNIDFKCSVKWFYGVDIDPIALQISIVNLLVFAARSDWETIISHFTFGNPLLVSRESLCEEEKNALFAKGRLYSVGLGLPQTFFEKTYDAVVGNPPWEKIRFEERKFFRGVVDSISTIPQKNIRCTKIEMLKDTWPEVFEWYNQVRVDYSKMTAAKYTHCRITDAITGELNTYSLFTDLAYNMLSENGILALIVKSTLVTAPAYRKLWRRFLSAGSVRGVYLFDNKNRIFNIDSRERFIVFIAKNDPSEFFEFAAGLTSPKMLSTCKTVPLTADDLLRINPFTYTIPNVSSNDALLFLQKAHCRLKLFSDVYPNCHFGRLIHLTAHTEWIEREASTNNIPIYEGKFIERYDARYATFRGIPNSKKYASKATAVKTALAENGKKELPESRYFIRKELWNKYRSQYCENYSLCWRSLTSPTNSRTMLAMILPTNPTCQSIQMLQTSNEEDLVLLLALFNSIPFDYFVRIKMPGLDLTQSVIKQIPVPSKEDYNEVIAFNGEKASLKKHILSYAISLLKEEDRLSGLTRKFEDKIYEVNMPMQEKQRMIDLLIKKAYHLDNHTYENILRTFSKY